MNSFSNSLKVHLLHDKDFAMYCVFLRSVKIRQNVDNTQDVQNISRKYQLFLAFLDYT